MCGSCFWFSVGWVQKKVLKYSGKQNWGGLLPLKKYVFLLSNVGNISHVMTLRRVCGWGSCSQLPPWFWGGPQETSVHTPTSLARTRSWTAFRLLKFLLPLPCSNQWAKSSSVADYTSRHFFGASGRWLIQRLHELLVTSCVCWCVGDFLLEATWWGNGVGDALFAANIFLLIPASTFLQLNILGTLSPPAPTSFICSLLE